MRFSKISLTVSLVVILAGFQNTFAADTGTFETTSEVQGLSGNLRVPFMACDSMLLTYDYTFNGQTLSGGFGGCCGLYFGFRTETMTNHLSGEDGIAGSFVMTVPSEICCTPSFLMWGVPSCFDQDLNYSWPNAAEGGGCNESARPSSFTWSVYLSRNSNSIPVATWEAMDATCELVATDPDHGFYRLTADGESRAVATLKPEYASATFVFTGDSLGCTLSNNVLTVSTNQGTVQVTAVVTNTDPCIQKDFYFDLHEKRCKKCKDASCTTDEENESVKFNIFLGASRRGADPAYLQVKTGYPTPALGTPDLLRCDFIRPGLEKITNASGSLRQVKGFERFVDIITNSATSYSLKMYAQTNVLYKSNGLYLLTGIPWDTVTVELVGGDTNQVRLTDSLASKVTDWVWQGDGWDMVTGSGLRHEVKSVSVAGATRTEVVTIKDNGGNIIRQSSETWQTNTYGDRLIRETFGIGADARTNDYTYTANGFLRQVTRGDGSWDIYTIDSQNRQIEHYSPFLNSTPTTNSAQCRLTTKTYTNSVVAGSGDDATLEPNRPRLVINYVGGVEVSRSYAVIKQGERREIQCPNPGATWNDVNNLVTITYLRTDSRYLGQPGTILNADGTIQLYTYTKQALPGTPVYDKTIILSGAPNGSNDGITRGTQEEFWTDQAGRTVQRVVTDIPSYLTLSSEKYAYDFNGRLTNTVYIDGTAVSQTYDCCGLASQTDRDGTVTSYTYDALKRPLATTRDGVTLSNIWSAAGDLVSTVRFGTNAAAIILSRSGYDTAGRVIASTNAVGEATTYSEVIDGSGQTIRTTINPDSSTRIETFARDGMLLRVEGTSVLGVRYNVATDTIGGVARLTIQEIRLLTNGTDSVEWTRSVNDGLGQLIQTEFADSSTNRLFYNSFGQMVKQVDPDGVVTLIAYDNLGQPEYHALDMDRNGAIDLAGTDRITRTVTDVVSNAVYGVTVRRNLTYVWSTANNATSTLLSEASRSVDGRQTWTIANGATNRSVLDYPGAGITRRTQIAPDGTRAVLIWQAGRILSVTISNALLGILQGQVVGYDSHNRATSVTDLRNGTATYSLDDADRFVTLTTPSPSPGELAQVSTVNYDAGGRVARIQAADGLWTTNEYYLTGLYRKTSGARVYPVEYAYDYAGRQVSMMTWQDYAGQTGAAVTTWKYDGYRGFLTNKVYAASEGPRYSYTKAGRLQVRTWARGTNTTYSYNNAGDLQSVDYADATPDVTYAYDRMGRPSQVTGATTNDLVYSLEGYLLSENVVNKAWNYTSQNRYGLDALKRRTALTNLTLGITHLSSYDAASRLQSVSTPDSGVLISYAYASNSPLVSGLTFQKGGFTRLTTSKQFDALERLMQVSSVPSGTSAVSSTYGYNAANQRTSLTNADGSYWRFGYDQLGQVTNGWRFWSDGSEVLGQTFNYAFDDVGNRRTVSAGAAASLRTQTYAVNALNQYTNRTVPGYVEASGSADSTASVTINGSSTSRHGEFFRQEVVVDNSGAPILQWLTNRAVIATGTSVVTRLAAVPRTPETISYDADGNLTQDGLWSYTWDGENRLTRIQTATNLVADSMQWRRIECSYDAMSRRVRKQLYRWTGSLWTEVESLRFFYDGWNLIGQIDEATGVKLSFAWGIDLSGTPQGAGGVGGLLAMTVHNGTNAGTYFYAYDGNGNVAAVINAADGSEAARYEYGPFAELTRSSGVMAQVNPFRYSTKYQDADSSLLCFGYRFFTPGLGRWLSRDSMDELGGVNLYCFVQNSAVNAIDPSGLFQVSLHKKITENAFDEESFKPVLKRKSYSKLLDGMKEGVEWVDLPGSFWSARDVFNPNQTLKKNPNKNSIWYKTHYGEYQFWHSMQNNEKTADELTQKIKAQILTYFNNGRKLYDECKFKEAGVEIGKGLHTIQDSFSKAHVVRDPFTGEITQFENYSAQDPHLHEKADEDTPGNERQITIATMISHRFLTIIFAEKYDASKVQILLDATFRIKSTGATMGGTAPEYKKP